jgi:uncharacterized protein (TIGR00369 family)
MVGGRTRTVTFDDPAASFAASSSKSGIELLGAIIEGTAPPSPIQATLGFSLLEVTDGFAKLLLEPGEHLYGSFNVVHGGVSSTLLDAAMSAAVLTTLDAYTVGTTASLTVNFTRAITTRMKHVIAEGWVVHRGSRLVTAEARLIDEQGRLLAHGSSVCSLTERAAPSERSAQSVR